MKARRAPTPPTQERLAVTLGRAQEVWTAVIEALEARHGPLAREWKPSKSAFGLFCLLKRKDRTLLYLTPEKGGVLAAVVLGERAVAAALAGPLPEEIRTRIAEAPVYAEGRGVRFPVRSLADVPVVAALVDAKTSQGPPAKRR